MWQSAAMQRVTIVSNTLHPSASAAPIRTKLRLAPALAFRFVATKNSFRHQFISGEDHDPSLSFVQSSFDLTDGRSSPRAIRRLVGKGSCVI